MKEEDDPVRTIPSPVNNVTRFQAKRPHVNITRVEGHRGVDGNRPKGAEAKDPVPMLERAKNRKENQADIETPFGLQPPGASRAAVNWVSA